MVTAPYANLSAAPLLRVLAGEAVWPPPVWLMRQAGRYLPEYLQVRATAPDFISFCLNPMLASEVTLQPLARFPLDAAIIFADILLVPYALGVPVQFTAGHGPQLPPLPENKEAWQFRPNLSSLLPVAESLQRVKAKLSPTQSLIGFAGSPFTVACYMIDGNSHTQFARTQAWAKQQPATLDAVLEALIPLTIDYLAMQREAGADCIQLFESWAGLLAHDAKLFERFVINPTQKIVAGLRARVPHTKIIGFPRGAGDLAITYASATEIDCLGLDEQFATAQLAQLKLPTQGWLAPSALVAGGEQLAQATAAILSQVHGRPHIFNLGHGITPNVPPAHVSALLAQIAASR